MDSCGSRQYPSGRQEADTYPGIRRQAALGAASEIRCYQGLNSLAIPVFDLRCP
jgi:hypothetical protein